MQDWVKRSWKPLLVAGIFIAASACGSSPSGLPLAGAGANSLAGNAGAGASDFAAGGPSDIGGETGRGGNRFDTENATTTPPDPAVAARYQACVSYMRAQCQRRFVECDERVSTEDPCIASLDRCPDIVFSSGSTWTVESLLSCADSWKSFSCDDIRQNKRPVCSMPSGSRPIGEPCIFANQCVTGNCSKLSKDGTGVPGYANCGTCGERVSLGETCTRPGYDCNPELTCNITSGKCETKAALGIVGEPCKDNSTCGGYGIGCRADPSDGVLRCLTDPVAGEACADFRCADGHSCAEGNVCASAPGLGETCASKGAAQCAVGLACSSNFDDPPYACVAPRQVGENCLGDARRAPRGSCAVGLRCDCGEPDCDLKSGICRQSRNAGETCSDKDSVCVPGTKCIEDVCVPQESQTVLTEICPPS